MEELKRKNDSSRFIVNLSKSDRQLLVEKSKQLNTTLSSLVRHLIRTNKSINDL